MNEAEEEERCVSIISSLLNSLARGSRRDRVCAKFVENEFEKCDHIMELYTRYNARVRTEEVRSPLSSTWQPPPASYLSKARLLSMQAGAIA